MSRIFICTPFKGESAEAVEANKEFARAVATEVTAHGYVPVAPHLYYPQILDDSDPIERDAGLKLGRMDMAQCDAVLVSHPKWDPYTTPPRMIDLKDLSDGMRGDVSRAEEFGLEVHYWATPMRFPLPDGPRALQFRKLFHAWHVAKVRAEAGAQSTALPLEDEPHPHLVRRAAAFFRGRSYF